MPCDRLTRRLMIRTAVILVITAAAACATDTQRPLRELQRVRAGMLDVVLLSDGDALQQGKGGFVLEFRDSQGNLVDVGTVNVSASMIMSGMAPMLGDNTVMPSDTRGRYHVASDFSMAGTWRLQISWDGPAGKGSATVPGSVL